ncbi:MAG: hypothetical protein WDW38_008598 [Sanguina aurantia]
MSLASCIITQAFIQPGTWMSCAPSAGTLGELASVWFMGLRLRQSRRLTLQLSPCLPGVTSGDVLGSGLSELQHLGAALTHLELCACAMIEPGPALSQLTGLQCLSLRGCTGLRPEGLTLLQQLSSLCALDLSGLEQWGDEHAWMLTGLKQLKVLKLDDTRVGDVTLQALSYGNRARSWMDLYGSQTAAFDQQQWPRSQIHQWQLARTHVTGEGVALLTDMPRLSLLDVRGTAVRRWHLSPPRAQPYDGPSATEVRELRNKYLSPSLFLHFKKPVMIVEGKMQYLFDETGRRYLDAFAGIVTVSVGHCHPHVLEAVNKQNKLLQHTTTIYLNPQVAQYAKELADKMPGNLKSVYFVNSGSEANDLAMMMARMHTGNWDLLCLRNGYHGVSIATMGACGHGTWKQQMPQGFGMLHALNPDPYRGAFGDDGPRYAEDVADLIRTASPGKVAGFMAETIQGVGGTVPLATGYLPAVYKMVRDAGGVCIADEVQSGFGRTGTNYWGFQNQNVQPDIVTMAKGIGNGLPLAAVVTTPEIAASIAGRLHFNTFGGNPVCSAAGRAVLEVIDQEQRMQHCATVGAHLLGRLHKLAAKHDIIGDIRGQGLMLGVELVKDRTTKVPATAEVALVFERMKDLGVLMGKGGLAGNVFRIKPPMCFSEQDADYLVDVMDIALSEL